MTVGGARFAGRRHRPRPRRHILSSPPNLSLNDIIAAIVGYAQTGGGGPEVSISFPEIINALVVTNEWQSRPIIGNGAGRDCDEPGRASRRTATGQRRSRLFLDNRGLHQRRGRRSGRGSTLVRRRRKRRTGGSVIGYGFGYFAGAYHLASIVGGNGGAGGTGTNGAGGTGGARGTADLAGNP